jgi:chitin synthase
MVSMQDSFDPYGRPPTFMHSHHSDSPDGSPQGFPRTRQDNAPLLMLPAPLALSNQHSSSQSSSLADSTYLSSLQPDVHPNYRLQRVPDDNNSYGSEYRDSDRSERDPILMSPGGSDSIMSPGGRNVFGQDAVVRNVPGGSSYPGETQNPYRHSQHHVAAYEHMPNFSGYSAELVDESLPPLPNPPTRKRGVSLVDPGVVINPDAPVRRTQHRASKRTSLTVTSAASSGATSRLKHQSLPPAPLSPPLTGQYLPPGAAPPQPNATGRYQGL